MTARSKPNHLWAARAEGRRGPKPTLTLEQLLAAAVDLADRHGLAALSMERVAQQLDVTPMALYRYVRSKGELVASMVDHGLGRPPPLKGSWRARLVAWSTAMAAVLHEHPWSLEATGHLRVMGPNELAWLEAGMAALAETKLLVAERHSACLALVSVIRTNAQFSTTRTPTPGLSGKVWATTTRALLSERDDYPQLTELLGAPARETTLVQSLSWVLDGIASRLTR